MSAWWQHGYIFVDHILCVKNFKTPKTQKHTLHCARVTISLFSASHVTHLNTKCVTYNNKTRGCAPAVVSLRQSPELADIQWNETATSDSVIVTPVIFVALKKARYFPQPLKMCYDFRARQRKRDTEWERGRMKRERGQTACTHICRCLRLLCMR